MTPGDRHRAGRRVALAAAALLLGLTAAACQTRRPAETVPTPPANTSTLVQVGVGATTTPESPAPRPTVDVSPTVASAGPPGSPPRGDPPPTVASAPPTESPVAVRPPDREAPAAGRGTTSAAPAAGSAAAAGAGAPSDPAVSPTREPSSAAAAPDGSTSEAALRSAMSYFDSAGIATPAFADALARDGGVDLGDTVGRSITAGQVELIDAEAGRPAADGRPGRPLRLLLRVRPDPARRETWPGGPVRDVIVSRGDAGWRIEVAVDSAPEPSTSRAASSRWGRVEPAGFGLSFEVPRDWARDGASPVWTPPDRPEQRVRVVSTAVGPGWSAASLLPAGARIVAGGVVEFGWGSGLRYVVEQTDARGERITGAELHLIVVGPNGRAYDFSVAGRTEGDVLARESALRRIAASAAPTGAR